MGAIVTDGGWRYGILLPIQMLSRRVGDPWDVGTWAAGCAWRLS